LHTFSLQGVFPINQHFIKKLLFITTTSCCCSVTEKRDEVVYYDTYESMEAMLERKRWQHLCMHRGKNYRNYSRRHASWKQDGDVSQPRKPTSEIKR
jgi:hypothetical protein